MLFSTVQAIHINKPHMNVPPCRFFGHQPTCRRHKEAQLLTALAGDIAKFWHSIDLNWACLVIFRRFATQRHHLDFFLVFLFSKNKKVDWPQRLSTWLLEHCLLNSSLTKVWQRKGYSGNLSGFKLGSKANLKMLNLIYFFLQSKFFLIIMQVLFFKIDFFFSFRKGMHLTVSQNEKRRVPCGAFLYALQLIYRLKKPLLKKRI